MEAIQIKKRAVIGALVSSGYSLVELQSRFEENYFEISSWIGADGENRANYHTIKGRDLTSIIMGAITINIANKSALESLIDKLPVVEKKFSADHSYIVHSSI